MSDFIHVCRLLSRLVMELFAVEMEARHHWWHCFQFGLWTDWTSATFGRDSLNIWIRLLIDRFFCDGSGYVFQKQFTRHISNIFIGWCHHRCRTFLEWFLLSRIWDCVCRHLFYNLLSHLSATFGFSGKFCSLMLMIGWRVGWFLANMPVDFDLVVYNYILFSFFNEGNAIKQKVSSTHLAWKMPFVSLQ